MNDLVIMKSRKALTTSLKVAEVFGKAHRTVLDKIKNLTAQNYAVGKMFAKISKNFHDAFHVARYEDLKKKDYDKAISYIKNWYPPYDLQNEIKEINAQTALNI